MMCKTVIAFFVLSAVCLHAEFIRDDNKSVVIDTARNLMWQDQKEVRVDSEQKRTEGGNVWNFHNAQTYCRDLDYGGFNDWFVPSSDQLKSATELRFKDDNYKSTPRAFQNDGSWAVKYWSSSTAPYRNTYGLSCERDSCRLEKMELVLSVRCVRNNNSAATLSKK